VYVSQPWLRIIPLSAPRRHQITRIPTYFTTLSRTGFRQQVLQTVAEDNTLTFIYLFTTFQPDWDIVEAIVRTLSQSKLVVTYKYVQGHQDEKTAYELLPFLAQLNVDADTYAGGYQCAYGSHRPIIPLSPTRPIALDLSGRTIHRNMKTEIRDPAHAIPLLNRMMKQNNWTPQVINLIHWDAHRLATSVAHHLRKTHFVKLCHGYLPAGKIAHRNNPRFPDSCPLCQSPAEDHRHILQCPHPS
jgi:hypothetical protein